MKVQTRSQRVVRARKTILEMLASTMDLSDAPAILTMLDEYGACSTRFPDAQRRETPVKDDNPMYVRDYSKCLLCWRCVQVCADDAQFTFALNFDGRGYENSDRHVLRPAHSRHYLCPLRPMRWCLPHRRPEA